MTTKTDSITRHVSLDEEGRVVSRRFHRYDSCSMFSGEKNGNAGTVTEREASLLGLKECAVCAKRAEGGPALDLLEGFFGEDYPFIDTSHELPREMARALIDYLKDHGAFVAIRKPKDNGSAT